MDLGPLAKIRQKYIPEVPEILRNLSAVTLKELPCHKKENSSVQKRFPRTFGQAPYAPLKEASSKHPCLKVGVVFSGGQAPGGHNVIAGLFDALMQINERCQLIGFLDGPSGIIEGKRRLLERDAIFPYRNQGGFDLIGSGRTKVETPEQFQAVLQNTQDLDGLVIIGGDDSNTNAALLAEFFLEKGSKTKVIGVPKTIDGDLRSQDIEISFGFDSACKTYSEIIGNIEKDALSSKKYYHFIKLMGRSASHITLECALQTRPNLALIGEEKKSLAQIVDEIADLIQRRQKVGKNYGVILIPEGLIEFMPEMKTLLRELNDLLAKGSSLDSLSQASAKIFADLPEKVQKQLTLERDSHGNVQVSFIETELLLIEKIKKKISNVNMVQHFLGYEGRSCLPTNFDANYCYSLGLFTALCIRDGLTGVIASIQHLKLAPKTWSVKAVPIVDLIHFEIRKGKEQPVIKKILVDINREPFVKFSENRKFWEIDDQYVSPGPIQFFGDAELINSVPVTLL
jgi:pyrophosphate--fructose-6-phosphate 1-phosphotransferase